MALAWTWLALPGILAFVLAVAAGIFVLRASPDRAVNRRLPPILVLEGALAFGAAALAIGRPLGASEEDAASNAIGGIVGVCLSALPFLYLRFLATLETPLVAWLRKPAVLRVLLALVPIGIVGALLPDGPVSDVFSTIIVIGGIVGVSIYGIVAAISLYRRSERGSARHARAGWYAAAFITRDALLASLVVLQLVAIGAGNDYAGGIVVPALVVPLAIFAYVPLMAYGALKAQLFDLDLKVKVGIERSTLLTIVAIGVLVTQRVVERYATATYGWIAAVVVAVGMLLLKSRLDKIATKVANTAMPQVQPTAGYVLFKKLEVYKAAVETALETGGIDARERLKLDRLREKMALSPEDCAAVESDVTRSAASPP